MMANKNGSIMAVLEDEAEKIMLSMDQVDAPVTHRFGPGIYIREVVLPRGIVALGHRQKKEHLNTMIAGKMILFTENGPRILEAPVTFTAPPGRKVALTLETVVWQNIYATYETDIATLEEEFLDKSDEWLSLDSKSFSERVTRAASDRDDYDVMLHEIDDDDPFVGTLFGPAHVVPMSKEHAEFLSVRKSPIHGVGLFTSWPINAGEVIIPAVFNGVKSEACRAVNHSAHPNSKIVTNDRGDMFIVAKTHIGGCVGGGDGSEITINYRELLKKETLWQE